MPARPLPDRVRAHVADRRLLVVLDNCEHVVDDVATVTARLLDAGPEVRIRATSRERRQLPDEVRMPLTPLDLSSVDAPLDDLTALDGVVDVHVRYDEVAHVDLTVTDPEPNPCAPCCVGPPT